MYFPWQERDLMCVCFCVPPGNVLLMKKVPPLPPHITVSSSETQQIASTGWCNCNLSICWCNMLSQSVLLVTIATSDLRDHMVTDDVITLNSEINWRSCCVVSGLSVAHLVVRVVGYSVCCQSCWWASCGSCSVFSDWWRMKWSDWLFRNLKIQTHWPKDH